MYVIGAFIINLKFASVRPGAFLHQGMQERIQTHGIVLDNILRLKLSKSLVIFGDKRK